MQNEIFHNNKSEEKNTDLNIVSYLENSKKKENVDINKLLNRVKIHQQIEKKQKFIFFSLGVLLLCSMGTFISILI